MNKTTAFLKECDRLANCLIEFAGRVGCLECGVKAGSTIDFPHALACPALAAQSVLDAAKAKGRLFPAALADKMTRQT